MVTLYGKGAVVIHDDKHAYKPENGQLVVPEHLVARALDLGFTRDRRDTAGDAPEPNVVPAALLPIPSIVEGSAPPAGGPDVEIPAVDVAPVTGDVTDGEIERPGKDSAAVRIAEMQKDFEDLVASGVPEDEARRLVWPPHIHICAGSVDECLSRGFCKCACGEVAGMNDDDAGWVHR